MKRERALAAIRGQKTDRVPHWEHFSNPDFEHMITGIDPYERPMSSGLRLLEILPIDVGGAPGSDDPIPRPPENAETVTDADGHARARWGTGTTWEWDWGKTFKCPEDVLSYEPLKHLDLRHASVVACMDYSKSVDDMARDFQNGLDYARNLVGDRALIPAGFYNTIFMWPLLTFGWELFLETAALHKEEMKRIIRDFSHLSRKVFQAWAKTDAELVASHDDICYAGGTVFSPDWLREMIYPYYEEFWGILRDTGKTVIFISDGNVDAVADDIVACGASGICSEPFTDWKTIARKHPETILIGNGDNRVLMSGDTTKIDAMVRDMAELGKSHPRYFMCLGNHIPWNIDPHMVKAYFEASEKYGYF